MLSGASAKILKVIVEADASGNIPTYLCSVKKVWRIFCNLGCFTNKKNLPILFLRDMRPFAIPVLLFAVCHKLRPIIATAILTI